MSNIELFYDHCAKVLESLYNHFPVKVNCRVADPDLDPGQISDEALQLYRQKEGALHWLHANKYITGYEREWSLEDAALSEKGMCFLHQFFEDMSEPSSADFRRAAEHLFS